MLGQEDGTLPASTVMGLDFTLNRPLRAEEMQPEDPSLHREAPAQDQRPALPANSSSSSARKDEVRARPSPFPAPESPIDHSSPGQLAPSGGGPTELGVLGSRTTTPRGMASVEATAHRALASASAARARMPEVPVRPPDMGTPSGAQRARTRTGAPQRVDPAAESAVPRFLGKAASAMGLRASGSPQGAGRAAARALVAASKSISFGFSSWARAITSPSVAPRRAAPELDA